MTTLTIYCRLDMDQTLTRWFPGKTKPVRIGIYETDPRGYSTRCFQYWSGEFWGMACTNPLTANKSGHRNRPSSCQNDKWRGLTVNPKGIK